MITADELKKIADNTELKNGEYVKTTIMEYLAGDKFDEKLKKAAYVGKYEGVLVLDRLIIPQYYKYIDCCWLDIKKHLEDRGFRVSSDFTNGKHLVYIGW